MIQHRSRNRRIRHSNCCHPNRRSNRCRNRLARSGRHIRRRHPNLLHTRNLNIRGRIFLNVRLIISAATGAVVFLIVAIRTSTAV